MLDDDQEPVETTDDASTHRLKELLLFQIGQQNPEMAQLLRQFDEMNSGTAKSGADSHLEKVAEEYEAVLDELERVEADADALKVRLATAERALEAERVHARQRQRTLSQLARALGACGRCLGELDDCEVCLGNGSPGWSRSDPELARKWIGPLLRSQRLVRKGATVASGKGHDPECAR